LFARLLGGHYRSRLIDLRAGAVPLKDNPDSGVGQEPKRGAAFTPLHLPN